MSTPSARPGLGATPYPGGVTFRVWAPNAPWVRVAGTFNGWGNPPAELAAEADGLWSADVAGAAVGDEYRYVLGRPDHWRVDPRARAVTQSDGNAVVTAAEYPWRVRDFTPPPVHELVVYEMHVATYPDRPVPVGDAFRAVADELDHLRDLGVNAIELMPAKEFPGDISWGYNPTHLFAVETAYGGPDGLKGLVDAAHAHGIAVILDVVYNHLGPGDLHHSVWQFDGWHQWWDGGPTGGVYFYNDWRAETPWGQRNRPDYGRPEVRRFLRDNALYWLEECGVDGLRFDMTCFIRNARGWDGVPPGDPTDLGGWGWNLLRWVNDDLHRLRPAKWSVAEDMRQNPAVTRPTAQGGAGFDAQWDDQFHHTIVPALVAARDEDRDMNAVMAAVLRRYDGDAFRRVVYTESHDEVGEVYPNPRGKQRVPEAIEPGRADGRYAQKRSTLGAAVVFTSPGVPMIFQGQEMLEWAQFTGGTRMDWGHLDRFAGIVRLYRDLIHLRRNRSGTTAGLCGRSVAALHVNDTDKVIAFHRWDRGGPGDDVVVVLNFGHRAYPAYTLGFPRPGVWRVRFNSDWAGYSPAFDDCPSFDTVAAPPGFDSSPCRADVGIGAYTAVILSLV